MPISFVYKPSGTVTHMPDSTIRDFHVCHVFHLICHVFHLSARRTTWTSRCLCVQWQIILVRMIISGKIETSRSENCCILGKKLCLSFRPAAILGQRINDLGHYVVVHMQLFWRSGKSYYSNIVQLEGYVVCYKILQAYLIESSHVIDYPPSWRDG